MMYDDDGWMWGHGWGLGGWVIMSVVIVLFVAVLVTALVVAIRYLTTPRQIPEQPAAVADRPEHLLAQRFASGEIDEDEYRRRIAVLREHS
ncbi:MAG: SHOCT domain-containing protein [Actinomycetia bacterium]|nr:SHOCT domain-containing protein [Actinomycetes bacterium]